MSGTITPTKRRPAAWAGARDMVPLLAGVVPLAFVIGVAIDRAAVDATGAWSASFLVAAGGSQLTAVDMLDRGAAVLVIVATVVVINSRFVLYSAGLAEWFQDEPRWRRMLLAFPLVDPLYALCATRFAQGDLDTAERRSYYTGAAALLMTGWVVAQSVALVFAASMPDSDVLELAAPLAFVGLLAAVLTSRAALTAAVVGAVVAAAAAGAPCQLALPLGIAAGVVASGWRRP